MDIRKPVLGILAGGSPAPGVNNVICSVTLEALQQGCDVIGIYEGYKRLREGKSKTIQLKRSGDVTRMQYKGGSILRTSKMQLTNDQEVDNVLRVLQMLRVRYLVTIGGTSTANSTSLVAAAAKKAQFPLGVVHVPKTIFNDLPLPENACAFGFDTARQIGMSLVQMFASDAATMVRWYILTCVGASSGHLALGIGKAAAASLTVIPEEYKDKQLKFEHLVDLIEATIYKRRIDDINYGICVLCEGLVDIMDKKEIESRWHDVDNGHQDLNRHIARELQARFKPKGLVITTVARNLGTECRAADPQAADIILSRDLGYGAVQFLLKDGTDSVVSLKNGTIHPIPFKDMIDQKTGHTAVRTVDTSKIDFTVAQHYMTKLTNADLADQNVLDKLAQAACITPAEFKAKFKHIAVT